MSGRQAGAGERGYAMAALLVAMSVMAVALSTAMPIFQTVARREKEAELVFRGEQYARAIGLFQRKYGNALPPDVDVLINERFLRKKYKDPITGDDFQLLGPGSPELAAALSAAPQQVQDAQQQGRGTGRAARGGQSGAGRGTQQFGRGGSQSMQGRIGQAQRSLESSLGRLARETQGDRAAGGILAVASKSTESSMRLYNDKGKYNEWIFMALQADTAAGAPANSGADAPGVRRGGRAGGRGGLAPGGGRGIFRGRGPATGPR
jgi:type II secretory pathway pseudopilin PulG